MKDAGGQVSKNTRKIAIIGAGLLKNRHAAPINPTYS